MKLKNGQQFDYHDWTDGSQYYELAESTYAYTVVHVTKNRNGGGADAKATARQFPASDVVDIRRL